MCSKYTCECVCVCVCVCDDLLPTGFLTDDLTIHEDTSDGSCKYFGVCLLPGEGRKVIG